MSAIDLTVYGAEVKCASCVNLPTAKETMEWLEAAVTRKFPEADIHFRYIDIHDPKTDQDVKYAEAILEDEYFYPLVVMGAEVIGEGNPKLKDIFEKIESLLK